MGPSGWCASLPVREVCSRCPRERGLFQMSQPKFPSYRLLPFCLITSHYSEFHCQLRPYSSESSCSTPLDSAHGVLLAGINKLTTLKLFLLAMCLYGCIFIVLVTLCWIISGFPTSFEPEGLRLATVGVAASTRQVESINNSVGSVCLLVEPGVRFASFAECAVGLCAAGIRCNPRGGCGWWFPGPSPYWCVGIFCPQILLHWSSISLDRWSISCLKPASSHASKSAVHKRGSFNSKCHSISIFAACSRKT